MVTIVNIETATEICSAALTRDGEVVIRKVSADEQSHSTLLGVYVEEIMRHVRESNITVDAVAVSSGPGSYTGLRIGVSEAKGLSYGLDVPLIAIPTHRLMAWQLLADAGPDTLLCPMIDARRMEVYTTFFDRSLHVVRETSADIVDGNSYDDLLEKHEVLFFGNGSDKCRDVIRHPNAVFVAGVKPLASSMAVLAEEAFKSGDFVDTAYFEPFYLKQFVATIAKNKVINV